MFEFICLIKTTLFNHTNAIGFVNMWCCSNWLSHSISGIIDILVGTGCVDVVRWSILPENKYLYSYINICLVVTVFFCCIICSLSLIELLSATLVLYYGTVDYTLRYFYVFFTYIGVIFLRKIDLMTTKLGALTLNLKLFCYRILNFQRWPQF